jgi:hypothetical protein
MQNLQIYALVLIASIILLAILALLLVLQRMGIAINGVKMQITQSVAPRFLQISPDVNTLADLAIEVWRLKNRIEKVESAVTDDQSKALQNSYSKIMRYLDRNDIGITEYSNQKYNEGMNLDVLSVEKDKNIKHAIIKETHEPAVTHKGQLIRKAKVILLEP